MLDELSPSPSSAALATPLYNKLIVVVKTSQMKPIGIVPNILAKGRAFLEVMARMSVHFKTKTNGDKSMLWSSK